MDDSAFAAEVRRLTGKETNSEALQLLRGGALGIGPDYGASAAPAETSGTKVDPSKFTDE